MERDYRKIKKFLFPPGTKREYIFELLLSGILYIKRKGVAAFIYKLWLKTINNVKTIFSPKIPNIYLLERNIYKRTEIAADLPSIDILIVTYNSEKCIVKCLDSLAEMHYNLKKINVILVDNNSKDGTVEKIKHFIKFNRDIFKKIVLIANEKNIGFGAANNQASKLENSKYIFILNPDTKIDENCLHVLTSYAVEDRQCAIWEARQLPYEHPKYYCPITLDTIWSSGAASLINRDIFEKIGGFDKTYFLYTEDVDLSFRLRSIDYCCRYIPEAIVKHFNYLKPSLGNSTQFFYSVRNNLIIRLKIGSLKDILQGFLQLLLLLAKQIITINSLAKVALKASLSQTHIFWKILSQRKDLKPILKKYNFFGWNYEYRKRGEFFSHESPKSNPNVSIIIRSLGRKKIFINEAIQSIINQTYKNLEVILVEDGSSNLIDLADSLKKKGLNIKYFSSQNHLGRSKSGNRGLSLSSGEFINLLDEDDLLYPTHIEILISQLLKHPSFKAAYTAAAEAKVKIINEQSGKYKITRLTHFFNNYSRDNLLQKNLFPIQSVLFHKSLYNKIGGFNENLTFLEDWDLWLRYSKLTDFLPLDITTSEFRTPAVLKEARLRINVLKKHEKFIKENFAQNSLRK